MLPPFSIAIPCFNEAARIGETVRATLDYLSAQSPDAELIVVNDGSTDATPTIIREALRGAKIQTRLLENFPNRGKGAAVRTGLLAATKSELCPTSSYAVVCRGNMVLGVAVGGAIGGVLGWTIGRVLPRWRRVYP